MNCFLSIPILGRHFYTKMNSVHFISKNNTICFIRDGDNIKTNLSIRRHSKLVKLIRNIQLFLPFTSTYLKSSKCCMIVCPIHPRSISFLYYIISYIYNDVVIDIELAPNIGTDCDLHLFDLYELGLFNYTVIERDYRYNEKIFLGQNLYAYSPLHNYLYRHDYVHVWFSKYNIEVRIYLYNVCIALENVRKRMNHAITLLLKTCFDNNDDFRSRMYEWETTFDIYYSMNKERIETISLLEAFSILLDIFPSYRIEENFTLTVNIEQYCKPYEEEFYNIIHRDQN